MESAHYKLKATISHMCPCSRVNGNIGAVHPGEPESCPAFWRPWELDIQSSFGETNGDHRASGSKEAHGFQHPVRLFMPKSKTSEYVQQMGVTVLANFPVQATIHFYNDDSDSEDEEEEEDYDMDFYGQYQDSDHNLHKAFGSPMVEDSMCSSSVSLPQEKPNLKDIFSEMCWWTMEQALRKPNDQVFQVRHVASVISVCMMM
ncbi:protein ripply3 [Pelodytes ibericus]